MKVAPNPVNNTATQSVSGAANGRQSAATAASADFAKQITAQRGQQANANSVKASNQMLGTLIDVKA